MTTIDQRAGAVLDRLVSTNPNEMGVMRSSMPVLATPFAAAFAGAAYAGGLIAAFEAGRTVRGG